MRLYDVRSVWDACNPCNVVNACSACIVCGRCVVCLWIHHVSPYSTGCRHMPPFWLKSFCLVREQALFSLKRTAPGDTHAGNHDASSREPRFQHGLVQRRRAAERCREFGPPSSSRPHDVRAAVHSDPSSRCIHSGVLHARDHVDHAQRRVRTEPAPFGDWATLPRRPIRSTDLGGVDLRRAREDIGGGRRGRSRRGRLRVGGATVGGAAGGVSVHDE